MSKVIAGFSMSLDGFVADPDDGVERLTAPVELVVTEASGNRTSPTSPARSSKSRESPADPPGMRLVCRAGNQLVKSVA